MGRRIHVHRSSGLEGMYSTTVGASTTLKNAKAVCEAYGDECTAVYIYSDNDGYWIYIRGCSLEHQSYGWCIRGQPMQRCDASGEMTYFKT